MAFDKPLYLRGFQSQPSRRGGIGLMAGVLFVLAILLVNWLVFFRGNASEPSLDQRLAKPVEATPGEIPTPSQPASQAEPETRTVEGALLRGETAVQALSRMGVPAGGASAALAALSDHVDMRALKAGQKLVVELLPDGKVHALEFPVDATNFIHVARADGEFVAEKRQVPTDKQTVEVACPIRGNLYASLQRCDVDQSLAPVITDLLAGQVDFFTDSRKGDVVRLIVERESLGGKFLKWGKVHGLVYEGRMVQASAFPVESGDQLAYYDAEGNAVERPFLRAPLKYSRVSSDFSMKRLHPILHTYTPHRAVDYAAPKGTPVYAVGEGKVVFNGFKGAHGNLVVLDHGNGAQTYYAHLASAPKNLKVGERVAKGALIAQVGSTGRSTGPHLHFAVAQNGAFVHPRKLLEKAGPKLPAAAQDDFKAAVGNVVSRLKALPLRGSDAPQS